MLQRHFVAERKSLLRVLSSLAHASVESRDWSAEALGRMLDELLLAFPVYRSYVGENGRSQADACLRSEEHTSELQSLMRISYAVFCLKKKKKNKSQCINYIINNKSKL